MAKKKKEKNIPFHVAHKFKEYELKGGSKFWALHDDNAELYKQKVGE